MCKTEKSTDNFNAGQKYCKPCNKEYQRKHYLNNKEYYSDKRKSYQLTTLQYIHNILKDSSCVTCGESRIATLQFDHIDPSKKKFSISRGRDKSIAVVAKEIEKCQILCANCHAVKTAKDFGWYEKYN